MEALPQDDILILNQAFDPNAESMKVRMGNPKVGAVVTFLGLMRDFNAGDGVSGMILEHYPGMTEKALRSIIDEAQARWDLEALRVVHRVGELKPEEPIVLVAVASQHRGEAFQACEFVIDYLKNRAPFWKKEQTGEGERWVDARDSDRQAEDRWRE